MSFEQWLKFWDITHRLPPGPVVMAAIQRALSSPPPVQPKETTHG